MITTGCVVDKTTFSFFLAPKLVDNISLALLPLLLLFLELSVVASILFLEDSCPLLTLKTDFCFWLMFSSSGFFARFLLLSGVAS